MATRIKRPTSVWVAQILLFLFGLIFLAPLVVTFSALFSHNSEASVGRLLLLIAANFAVIGLIAAALWGMFRRRAYGRWLGVAMLAVSFAMMVIGQMYGASLTEGAETAARSAGSIAGQALISILFILLLCILSFDRRVAAFFSERE